MTKLKVKHGIGQNLIVKPDFFADVVSEGGIVITAASEYGDGPCQGTVIGIGMGPRDENGEYLESDIKVGDVILYARNTGKQIMYEGEKLYSLPYNSVMANLGHKPVESD